MNKKYFQDDTLFAAVFSYICAELTYSNLQPVDLSTNYKKRTVIEYRLEYDANMNQRRVAVKKKI